MTNIPGTWQNLAHTELLAEQGIMQESATQKFPLGKLVVLDDGRKFRYCKNGAVALAAGKLVQSVHVATERDASINGGAVVAIGATSLTFTAVGTIPVNSLAEGFLHIPLGTGLGLQYKIKANTVATAGNETTITLYDPIVTALAATTDGIVEANPYTGVLLAADDLAYIIGVPVIPVTEAYYFWAQSGGIGMCLQNGSTGVATTEREVYADVAGGTDGACLSTAGGAVGKQQIGYHYYDTTDVVSTEYWPIVFTID